MFLYVLVASCIFEEFSKVNTYLTLLSCVLYFFSPTVSKHASLGYLVQGKCEITELSMHVAGLLKLDCEHFHTHENIA